MNYFDTDNRKFAKEFVDYGVFSTDDTLPYEASEESAMGEYVHPLKDIKRIKVTKPQLHDIIRESVKRVLKEEIKSDYDSKWDEYVRREKFNLEDLESKVPVPYRARIHQMVVELDSFLDDIKQKREWENWNN